MESKQDRKKVGVPPLATALSLIACYGTIAAIALLGALGVTIALNEAAWAGAIVLFAGLATAAIFMRWRKHHQHLSLVLAAVGFLLIACAMYVSTRRSPIWAVLFSFVWARSLIGAQGADRRVND